MRRGWSAECGGWVRPVLLGNCTPLLAARGVRGKNARVRLWRITLKKYLIDINSLHGFRFRLPPPRRAVRPFYINAARCRVIRYLRTYDDRPHSCVLYRCVYVIWLLTPEESLCIDSTTRHIACVVWRLRVKVDLHFPNSPQKTLIHLSIFHH